MLWAVVACAAAACAHTGAHAQLLACTTDEQCEIGFYCDRDVAYTCRRCLNCELLKREPPLVPSHCIKSVAECGSCITGLVEDLRGDVSLECVPPDARSGDAAIPAYAWVIISIVALLLFALVVFIVTYVLRNTYTFKILAYYSYYAATRASVQSPRGAGAGVNGVASAPDLPPPYNAHYSAVRPTSPPPPHSPDRTHDDAHSHGEESSWPFIKRTPSIQVASHGGERESAGSQAARVYSNPSYVRGPQLPPSYDGAGVVTMSASDDERDALAHDEDTMESTWTPSDDHHDNNNASGGAASELSSQLEAALGTALIRAPHHQPCGWQESNNRSAGEAEGGAAGSSNAPAFVINVVQTIHTQAPPRHVQQP